MTPQEKHALIAEKIEGWQWVGRQRPNGETECCWLLPSCDEKVNAAHRAHVVGPLVVLPEGVGHRAHWHSASWVPNYSADLNLCARAEARIAAMGLQDQYGEELAARIPMLSCTDWLFADAFLLATAPASARVDAMCALIQSKDDAA